MGREIGHGEIPFEGFEWKTFMRENRWMKHSFTCGWNFVPGGFGTGGTHHKASFNAVLYIYI